MKTDPRTNTSSHIAIPAVTAEDAASPLYQAIVNIITRLNGKIDLGTGENQELTGNVIGVCVDVLTPPIADTDFIVYHNLGYVPQRAIVVNKDRFADIKVSPTQTQDTKTFTLRCSVASATLKIWIH